MAQITWKNIDAPNFGTAGSLITSGTNLASKGFEALANVGDARRDLIIAAQKQADKDATSAALEEVRTVANLGGLNKLSLEDIAAKYSTGKGTVNLQDLSTALFDQEKTILSRESSQASTRGQNILNQGNLIKNKGYAIDNESKLIRNEGFKIDNQGKLISNEGKLIRNEGFKIDNQGKIIANESKLIKNEGYRLDNQGKIIANVGRSLDNVAQSLANESKALSNRLAADTYDDKVMVSRFNALNVFEDYSNNVETNKLNQEAKKTKNLIDAGSAQFRINQAEEAYYSSMLNNLDKEIKLSEESLQRAKQDRATEVSGLVTSAITDYMSQVTDLDQITGASLNQIIDGLNLRPDELMGAREYANTVLERFSAMTPEQAARVKTNMTTLESGYAGEVATIDNTVTQFKSTRSVIPDEQLNLEANRTALTNAIASIGSKFPEKGLGGLQGAELIDAALVRTDASISKSVKGLIKRYEGKDQPDIVKQALILTQEQISNQALNGFVYGEVAKTITKDENYWIFGGDDAELNNSAIKRVTDVNVESVFQSNLNKLAVQAAENEAEANKRLLAAQHAERMYQIQKRTYNVKGSEAMVKDQDKTMEESLKRNIENAKEALKVAKNEAKRVESQVNQVKADGAKIDLSKFTDSPKPTKFNSYVTGDY